MVVSSIVSDEEKKDDELGLRLRQTKKKSSITRSRRYLRASILSRTMENVPWYIIDQDEIWRIGFDMGSSALLVGLLFYLPYTMAFLHDVSKYTVFDWIVLVWFSLDIILSFLTTYTTSYGEKVCSLRRIAKRYVKGYFFLDLVATVPWSLMLLRDKGDVRLGPFVKLTKFPKLVRALRFSRFSKVFRSGDLGKGVPDLCDLFPRLFPPVLEQLSRFLAIALILNHIFACVWYALGVAPYKLACVNPDEFLGDRQRRDCTWMQVGGYRARSGNYYLYVTCLYWSLTTISTVGFGDVTANTATEKLFTCFVMIVGVTFNTVLISAMGRAVLAASTNPKGSGENSKTVLRAYLYRHNVPTDLSSSIVSYLRHHFTVENEFGETAEETDPEVWRLLRHLNKPLMRRLTLHVSRKSIRKLPFLQTKSENFIADCVLSMRAYVASPSEVLVTRNSVVRTALNLIAQGACVADSSDAPNDNFDCPAKLLTSASIELTEDRNTDEEPTQDAVPLNEDDDDDDKWSLDDDNRGCPETWHLGVGDYFGDEGIILGAAWVEPLVALGWCELQIIAPIPRLLEEYEAVRAELAESARTKVAEHDTILAVLDTALLPDDDDLDADNDDPVTLTPAPSMDSRRTNRTPKEWNGLTHSRSEQGVPTDRGSDTLHRTLVKKNSELNQLRREVASLKHELGDLRKQQRPRPSIPENTSLRALEDHVVGDEENSDPLSSSCRTTSLPTG